ncbi:hypothetical protein A3709_16755 [Halioglobus sp. HI00S01]|uniref:hypothetical protein n=1 Tax=Halioglobus sp. HI00S01 TaxID=1822214 RepID=UPI0007C28C7A|nr:hypothetical protein [Halioglobus sp. HI00S01]KZX59192.1 hypothetical protein A3709_16755 [Halioglobus sp. HI00S01]
MISESHYWKDELLDVVRRLKSTKAIFHERKDALFQLEKDLLVGFYSVRKLIEARTKVTDETRQAQYTVQKKPNIKPVNHVN